MFFVFLISICLALDVSSVPNPRKHNLWVVDVVDIIDEKTEQDINAYIEQLHQDSGVEIALVTVQDVSETPKDFATALFNHWGIGDNEDNNGLLILMVMGNAIFGIVYRIFSRLLPTISADPDGKKTAHGDGKSVCRRPLTSGYQDWKLGSLWRNGIR